MNPTLYKVKLLLKISGVFIMTSYEVKSMDSIKNHINNLSLDEIGQLKKLLYRTFNYMIILEDLDIKEVNELQKTPREDNISMTSAEFMNECQRLLNIDVE